MASQQTWSAFFNLSLVHNDVTFWRQATRFNFGFFLVIARVEGRPVGTVRQEDQWEFEKRHLTGIAVVVLGTFCRAVRASWRAGRWSCSCSTRPTSTASFCTPRARSLRISTTSAARSRPTRTASPAPTRASRTCPSTCESTRPTVPSGPLWGPHRFHRLFLATASRCWVGAIEPSSALGKPRLNWIFHRSIQVFPRFMMMMMIFFGGTGTGCGFWNRRLVCISCFVRSDKNPLESHRASRRTLKNSRRDSFKKKIAKKTRSTVQWTSEVLKFNLHLEQQQQKTNETVKRDEMPLENGRFARFFGFFCFFLRVGGWECLVIGAAADWIGSQSLSFFRSWVSLVFLFRRRRRRRRLWQTATSTSSHDPAGGRSIRRRPRLALPQPASSLPISAGLFLSLHTPTHTHTRGFITVVFKAKNLYPPVLVCIVVLFNLALKKRNS